MKRGIFFTLDAMVASISAVAIVSIVLFSLHSSHQDHLLPSMQAVQFMHTAYHSGVLDAGVSDAGALQTYVDGVLSARLCGNITIYDDADSMVQSAQKAGCTQGLRRAVAVRSFYNASWYYAKGVVWYQ